MEGVLLFAICPSRLTLNLPLLCSLGEEVDYYRYHHWSLLPSDILLVSMRAGYFSSWISLKAESKNRVRVQVVLEVIIGNRSEGPGESDKGSNKIKIRIYYQVGYCSEHQVLNLSSSMVLRRKQTMPQHCPPEG